MSVYGNATTDLCYLLYSSSTGDYRRHNLDRALAIYFQVFETTLSSLGVSEQFALTLRDLKNDFCKVKQIYQNARHIRLTIFMHYTTTNACAFSPLFSRSPAENCRCCINDKHQGVLLFEKRAFGLYTYYQWLEGHVYIILL